MRIPPEQMTPRQRLAQPFILRGIFEGLSGRMIYSLLRSLGVSYNYNEFWKDVNYWRNATAKSLLMRFVSRTFKIPEEFYIPNWWRERGGFQTIVRALVKDPSSGEIKKVYVTVVHEHLEKGKVVPDEKQIYTRKEIEEKALELLRGKGNTPYYEVINLTPVMGFKNLKQLRR